MLDRGRLDCLDELQPDDMELIYVFCFLFDLAHESWIKRRENILDGCTIVVFIVFDILGELGFATSFGSLDSEAGATFDDVGHACSLDHSPDQEGRQWCPSRSR